jgi:colicin import membrane protein
MWNFINKRFLPFALAVAVHLVLLAFFVVNLDWFRPQPPPPQVDLINATVVDETKVQQELDQLKKAEEQKRRAEQDRQKRLEEQAQAVKQQREAEEQRLKVVEQQRRDEEKRAKEAEQARKEEQRRADEVREQREKEAADRKRQQAEEAKRKEEEAKHQAEAEAKRKEEEVRKRKEEEEAKRKQDEERKRKEREEQARREREQMLKQQLEQEAKAMDAAAERARQRALAGYRDAIRQDVERAWRKPPNASVEMSCVVRVSQIPGGEVVDAAIVTCNTNDQAFQQSVVAAVHRASPLPVPQDSSLFQREIEFTFSPRE